MLNVVPTEGVKEKLYNVIFALQFDEVSAEQISHLLHTANLRVTRPRTEVLQCLMQAGSQAMSSQDIEQALEDIDRITLYRILRSFDEAGLIHSVSDGSGTTKYAMCSHDCSAGDHHDDHLNFYCNICETTTCLDKVTLPKIKLPDSYQLEELRFVATGICKDCK